MKASSLLTLCLLSPAVADSELVGKWKAFDVFGREFTDEFLGGTDVVMNLEIKPDGEFEAEVRMILVEQFNFLEFVLAQLDTTDLEIPAMDLLIETFSFRAVGTYSIAGKDEILFTVTEEQQLINDQPAIEFVTEVAAEMAPLVADVLEIPEDRREEFVETFPELLLGDLAVDTEGDPFFEGFGEEGILFSLDGDRLTLGIVDTEDAETLEFQRVPDFTAVETSTWGAIKSRR